MTRQQKLRMKKESRFNAIALAKRIHRKRICFECGTPINIQKETGEPVLFRFIKKAFPNTPWIEIERQEHLHKCDIEKLCSYSLNRKIKMMIV